MSLFGRSALVFSAELGVRRCEGAVKVVVKNYSYSKHTRLNIQFNSA